MKILHLLRIRHPADLAAYAVAAALVYIMAAANPQATGAALVGGLAHAAATHAPQSMSVYGGVQ